VRTIFLIAAFLFFPQQVSQLQVALTVHGVVLNWGASSSAGVTSYNVYRGSQSGGPYALAGNVGALTYSDGCGAAGTTCYYTVTALDAAGDESGYSNEVSATIPSQ
jgi:fibronectin type 3 domain-containing protein